MSIQKLLIGIVLIFIALGGFKYFNSNKGNTIQSYGRYDYIDSISIDNNGNYAITYMFYDSIMACKVNFYKRKSDNWYLIQTIDSLESNGASISKFEDFNNDKVFDFILYKGTGARGANEFYYVFLVDTINNRLVRIKNADDIPNIEIDCNYRISGTYYYGGTSFINFRLIKDSLIETDGTHVEVENDFTIRSKFKIDLNGRRLIVSRDSIKDGGAGLYSPE